MSSYAVGKASGLNFQHRLAQGLNKTENNMRRLSSGKRVNRAADDAAALAIAQTMSSELRSMSQAQRNTLDGVSMLQTAEGGMDVMANSLGRMRELAIQASNGTLSDGQRDAINNEFQSLRDEVDRVSATTEFNGKKLLDGSSESGMELQVGTGDASTDQMDVSIDQLDASTMGDDAATLDTVSLSSQEDALSALSALDGAISTVSGARASVGSMQNRLQATSDNLSVMRENTMAAQSRIEDADIAAEASARASNEILNHTNVAVMGQSNRLSMSMLRLLEG